jgi:hypothetical protein
MIHPAPVLSLAGRSHLPEKRTSTSAVSISIVWVLDGVYVSFGFPGL